MTKAGDSLMQTTNDAQMIAEIERLTAERDAALAGAVKVKPLRWVAKNEWHYFTEPDPATPLGGGDVQYRIKHYVSTHYWDLYVKHYVSTHYWDLYGPGHWGPGNEFPTLEAAQAAAQADHEARIRASLEPNTIAQCCLCGLEDIPKCGA